MVIAALKSWWKESSPSTEPPFYGVYMNTQDPLNIAPLRAMVRRAKKGGKSEVQIPRRQTRSRTVRNSFVRANFPLEVVLLILDGLPGVQDLYYATLAFRWRLPALYWKARFPCQLIVELDGLELDDQEWQYVYGEYVRLACCNRKPPPALLNRQRIFRILERAKDNFVEAAEEEKKRKGGSNTKVSAG